MRRKGFSALAFLVFASGGWLLGSTAFAAAPMAALDGLTIANPAPAYIAQDQSPLSLAPEWTAFETSTGQGWRVAWNQATGLPHRAFPAGFDTAVRSGVVPEGMTDRAARAAVLDAAAVDRMSRDLYETLRSSYPALPASGNLQVLAIEKAAGVWWVVYGQTEAGLRVESARADFRYSADGKLLYFGLDLIPGTLPSASAVLDGAAAERAAIDDLARSGLPPDVLQPAAAIPVPSTARQEREHWVAETPEARTTLVYFPAVSSDGSTVTALPAWVVRTEVSDPPARFVSWIDAASGAILQRENEIRYDSVFGHADADVQEAEPTDPYVVRAQPWLRVTVDGVGETFTNSAGDYSITTPDGSNRQVTSALTGSYGHIYNYGGPAPLFQGTATPGTAFPIHFDDTNSDAAARDSYYSAMVVHDYMKGIDPGFNGVDYEMPINVNLNQTCNAYWDGYSINFFRAGGGCANTGQIPDVVYHEYGHGVSQFVMAPTGPSGAEGEGFSDYIAVTITDQPLIGRGFTGPGSYLRTCDNDRQWPAPECGGEVHCVGEVIAGALWHMRVNMVDHFGHARGVSHADTLFHYARYGRQQDFEGYYYDVLAVDDNNGTLVDGTPNDTQIVQAFDRHNIGPGWNLDILHTPLHDTEDTQNPYPVVAVFSSPAELITDSLGVYYSTQPVGGGQIDGPHRLAMVASGNIREYQSLIPAQPLGTKVYYYVKGAIDTLGVVATNPPDAPNTQHDFIVNIDHTPPVIAHLPLYHKSEAIWPVAVEATVTDNQSVGEVQVEWRLNGTNQTSFPLNQVGDSDLYRGLFTGSVVQGDQIQYRLHATDQAQDQNFTYLPIIGYFQFNIVHDLVDDAEHGQQDLTHTEGTPGFHDQWHISTRRAHAGTHAWKFGSTGSGPYTDSGDGVLFTPPVRIGLNASLSFWHWIQAEQNSENTAWDGGVVELSTDAGASWNQIAPLSGYTHTIVPNPASPFPPGYPCWSGTFDWRLAEFNLAAYQDQTVQIRIRFGSDGAVTYEGWYIDDFDLNPGQLSSAVAENERVPLRSALLGNSPNPFGPTTRINFAVAAGAGPVRLDVLDVSGRRIRTLIDGRLSPGVHSANWDGRSEDGHPTGSGVYFTRLRVGQEEFGGKMLRMK